MPVSVSAMHHSPPINSLSDSDSDNDVAGPSGRPADACSSRDPYTHPVAPAMPPVVRGPCAHPWPEYVATVRALLDDPTSTLLQAKLARLRRQAQRTLELHFAGRIPPLDLDALVQLDAIRGARLPAPHVPAPAVFPHCTPQAARRVLHRHSSPELRAGARAADARHRRRTAARAASPGDTPARSSAAVARISPLHVLLPLLDLSVSAPIPDGPAKLMLRQWLSRP
eukprot:5435114-Amphidinium_carterae.2